MSSFLKKVAHSARKTGHAVGFVLGLKDTFSTSVVSATVSARKSPSHSATASTRNEHEYEDDEVASEWPEPVAVRSLRVASAIFEAREKAIEVEERERAAKCVFVSAEASKKAIDRIIVRINERKEELACAYDTIKRYEDNVKRIEADTKERKRAVKEREAAVKKRECAVKKREETAHNAMANIKGHATIKQATSLGKALKPHMKASMLSPSAVNAATKIVKSLEFAVGKVESHEETDDAVEELEVLGNTIILAKRLLEAFKAISHAQAVPRKLNKRKETATKFEAAIVTEALLFLACAVTFVDTKLGDVVNGMAFGDRAFKDLKTDIACSERYLDMIFRPCHY
ncbi:hypothetical protein GGI17_004594 [Coemansia sp. S146]|nr:hypothetical protein GGI17_004594 [Coemansia sp. S146]